MAVIPEPIAFDWDKGNVDKSYKKHGITPAEAEQIFVNEPLVKYDREHSINKVRYQAIGVTNRDKTLFVSFTIRDNCIRIISARPANREEQELYHE